MKINSTDQIRDTLLEQALPEIAFDGWIWDVAERSAESAGYDKAMAKAVFPGGLSDFVAHLSDWGDRQMLDSLSLINLDDMRIRDRIHLGVMTRIEILSPWREAVRRAMAYWSVPHRSLQAGRIVWRSADRIWLWAGDTAQDYNHYTKRALLGGVISTTSLAWLNDDAGDLAATEAFLDRRIDNVMKLGKKIGKFRKSA
jgi:ubiquinone biosynthesis protein COQ9